MRRPPRDAKTGIFTRPVVALILAGGVWSALVNLGLFVWALGTGRSLAEAMSLAFLSLVLIQFFKAYNFRSDRHSVLRRPFDNRWLNLAIAGEVLLLPLLVYVPVLSEAFGTAALGPADWALVLALAATVKPVLEAAKWMVRRGWFGPIP
jgi:Ca2+-transporting ATPase